MCRQLYGNYPGFTGKKRQVKPLFTFTVGGLNFSNCGTRLIRTPKGHVIVSVLSGPVIKSGLLKKHFTDARLIVTNTEVSV